MMKIVRVLKSRRVILHLLWTIPVCGILVVAAIDFRVSASSQGRLYSRPDEVPAKPVALVLGSAKYVDGRLNLFYTLRIKAAAELFEANKVRGILVSGDNSRKDYDEPSEMKQDLVARGVPEEYVTIDYAGFRTLDSVVRAKQVFGQNSFVVVSQKFHCQRAIYIARAQDIDAVAYLAGDVVGTPGMKVRLRECLARTKAFLDLHLFNTAPKYLGKPETVALKPVRSGAATTDERAGRAGSAHQPADSVEIPTQIADPSTDIPWLSNPRSRKI
jgi:SanA protein